MHIVFDDGARELQHEIIDVSEANSQLVRNSDNG